MIKKYLVKAGEYKKIVVTESGEYLVELSGEEARVKVESGFLLKNNDVCKIKLAIHHLTKNTYSKVLLKAVGENKAEIELRGKIVVDKNCDGVNAELTQRVLTLSDEVEVVSAPELEILTDDVICSHASSVSSVSIKQFSYLMSRGLIRKEAEELIVKGFLNNNK